MEELVSGTIAGILNSEMGKIAIPVAIFVIGVLLGYKWLKNAKAEEIKSQDEMYDKVENYLKKQCDEFSYHNIFSKNDAIDWIDEQKQKLLDQGCKALKALIWQAESEHCKMVLRALKVDVDKINFDKFGKFLIIRIYKSDDIEKSCVKLHVVKYSKLDKELEDCLKKDGGRAYY